jgi:hypothetical protein
LLFSSIKNEDKHGLKVATGLIYFAHAEERAEVLRKQLIELIEKETATRVAWLNLTKTHGLRTSALTGRNRGMRTAEMRDIVAFWRTTKEAPRICLCYCQSRIRLRRTRQADQLRAGSGSDCF